MFLKMSFPTKPQKFDSRTPDLINKSITFFYKKKTKSRNSMLIQRIIIKENITLSSKWVYKSNYWRKT